MDKSLNRISTARNGSEVDLLRHDDEDLWEEEDWDDDEWEDEDDDW